MRSRRSSPKISEMSDFSMSCLLAADLGFFFFSCFLKIKNANIININTSKNFHIYLESIFFWIESLGDDVSYMDQTTPGDVTWVK